MEILKAHQIGKSLKLTPMQKEAYILATLETATFNIVSPLDSIEDDVCNGKEISPTFFSTLLIMVNIKNYSFPQLVRILTRSCNLMHLNCPEEITSFFQSEGFFMQFIHINTVIDDIWVLRKEEPTVLLKEWKMKHKLIFQLRKKLLNFLEKRFGHHWIKDLKDRAELERKTVRKFGDGSKPT